VFERRDASRRGLVLLTGGPPPPVGGDDVPDDVRRFVRRSLTSAAELEILVFVRARCDREWTAAALSGELGLDQETAGRHLFDLMSRRALRLSRYAPPTYAYDPRPPELRRTIDRLAAIHAAKPDALLDLIPPPASRGMQLFADAFRLREEE
jgi:hypothetical protein